MTTLSVNIQLAGLFDSGLIDITEPMADSVVGWTVVSTSPLVLRSDQAGGVARGGWALSTVLNRRYIVSFEVGATGNITGGAIMQVTDSPDQEFASNPRYFYPVFGGDGSNILEFTGTGNTMYIGPALFIDQGDSVEFLNLQVIALAPPSPFTADMWTITDLETGGDASITVSTLPDTSDAEVEAITAYVGETAYTLTAIPGFVGTYNVFDAFTDGVATDVYLTITTSTGESNAGDTKSVTTSLSGSAPSQMTAPSLSASGGNVTVTLAADPANGGQPITRRDIRWSTDEASWTTIIGADSPEIISTNLSETLIYAQSRAVNGVGEGAWSTSATVTTGVYTPPAPPDPGDFALMTFANPTQPTRAEVERLARERWHTRPDWWIAGTTPKTLTANLADLPAGLSYNASTNLITVTGDVPLLDGWDFAATGTPFLFTDNLNHGTWSNCKFAPPGAPKSERMNYLNDNGWNANVTAWQFTNGSYNIHWDHIFRCWWEASPDYEGGAFNGTATINGNSPGETGYPEVDLMEFCSIEAHGQDGIKSSLSGVLRYCYFDCQTGVPQDAEEWQSGKTYYRNDVVWGGSAAYLRICRVASTTQSPSFGSKDASTTDWLAIDPHGDHRQSFGSKPVVGQTVYGCFFNSDHNKRRFADAGFVRGVASNGMRHTAPNGDRYGPIIFEWNIMPREVELAFSGQRPLSMTAASGAYWPGATVSVQHNHFNVDNNNSIANITSGGFITIENNTPNYDWWSPATLTSVTASYSGGNLTVGLTPSLGGWATVVLSTSATPMTYKEIMIAKTSSAPASVRAWFQFDAKDGGGAASGAHTVALSAGTYYAHILYSAGGILSPVQVQTVSV